MRYSLALARAHELHEIASLVIQPGTDITLSSVQEWNIKAKVTKQEIVLSSDSDVAECSSIDTQPQDKKTQDYLSQMSRTSVPFGTLAS